MGSANFSDTRQSSPVRVYFLGSGRLGVPVLQALLADPRIRLLGIGTQPDEKGGRHRRLLATPVGRFAAERGLDHEKPTAVNAPEFVARLQELAIDVLLVVAYGRILKSELLNAARHGSMNVHASLLPRHRGAAPVSAAILAGDPETGITFMRMDPGLDTGPIYTQYRLPLHGTETAEELEAALASLAGAHIGDDLWRICRAGLTPRPQPATGATYAAKLAKQDGEIDWTLPADKLERRVRAFVPWPRAWFGLTVQGQTRRVQVLRAAVESGVTPPQPPGQVLQADSKRWLIACGRDALQLLRVVPEGRGEMPAEDFLRGCPVLPGSRVAGGRPRPA